MYSGYARMENTTLIPKSHKESKKYHNYTTITRQPNSTTRSKKTISITPKDADKATPNKLSTRVFINASMRKSTFTKISEKILCRK